MRRVMLLVLLAIALPTAALATVIVFDTGTFTRGTISRNGLGGLTAPNIHIFLLGSGDEITVDSSVLTPGFPGGCSNGSTATGMCTFATGTVEVHNPLLTVDEFTASLEDGKITKLDGEAIITAGIVPGSGTIDNPACMPLCTAPGGGFVNIDAFFNTAPGDSLIAPSHAALTLVPEPSSMLLLGSGVLGLAGVLRRKLCANRA